MNWSEYRKAIDDGNIAPVYLFTGPEEYVKREALEALKAKLLPPGLETLNDTTLEGVTAQQITDAAETMPMMCEKRIVTVRDWVPLMSGKSKNEEQEVEWMQRWLENPSPSCVLIFYMRESADGKKKLTTFLKKKAVLVDFQPLTDSELSKWCRERLKPYGKKLTPQALNTMTFMAGRELTRLSGELEKLTAYVGDERSEITEEDVRAIVPASLEYNVFELMNHLLNRDMLKAQQTVNSLIQGGQNPIGLLAMLTRQVRQMTHMKCALDAGEPVQRVQDQLKMHPYAAKQTARQCARLSAAWLEGLYDTCVQYDFAVKNGRMRDQDALNAILFRIGLSEGRAG